MEYKDCERFDKNISGLRFIIDNRFEKPYKHYIAKLFLKKVREYIEDIPEKIRKEFSELHSNKELKKLEGQCQRVINETQYAWNNLPHCYPEI